MTETKAIPISVYAESTPNPATMKFVANKFLVENGEILEFTSSESAKESPLASELLNFPFVTGVFISGNFISVTKNNSVEWIDVTLDLREFIKEYLSSGKEIVGRWKSQVPNSKSQIPIEKENKPVSELNETEQKIVELLEEYIRPAVEQDGGAIHFKSFENGTLKVILRGSCSGCPSSSYTLKAGIQGLFARMLPEVKEVVAEEM